MNMRTLAAGLALGGLALTACGGGESATMGEDRFLDEVTEICDDAMRDLERIDAPADAAETERFAQDVAEVYTEAQDRLAELSAPDEFSRDFADFADVIDDQIKAFGDLEDAGKGDDDAAIAKAFERIVDRNADQAEIAAELGVDECAPTADPITDATTDATTDASTGSTPAAPVTTAGPALTLPPTVPPVVTASPVATTAPTPVGAQFSVVDLNTIFSAPEGFTLRASEPGSAQGFVDLVASVPALNEGLSEIGVGVLADNDTGDAIATIVVGIAIGDAMPAEWKSLLCGDQGQLRTSGEGILGIACAGTPDTNVFDIFTLTEGDTGVSVASVVDGISADLVADAFFSANFG